MYILQISLSPASSILKYQLTIFLYIHNCIVNIAAVYVGCEGVCEGLDSCETEN